MSPLDRDILRRKLETITANLRLLEPIGRLTIESYRSDVYRRKAAERLLQEVVEAAADVNTHLLVQTGRPAPDDLYSSFTALGEHRILDAALADAPAPSAGLRNRLVHEYDRLDDALVLEAVRAAIGQYPRYVAGIERFLGA